MLDPISNQLFSHDAIKYIYQNPDVVVSHGPVPSKPFEVKAPEKTDKSKKDLGKNKQQNKNQSKKY